MCVCALFAGGCLGERRVTVDEHQGGAAVWPAFRGGAAGGAGVASESVAPKLGLLWKVKIEGGFRSSPVVDDKRVYIGSLNGGVYAFDRERGGKPKWKFETKDSVIAPPVVDGGEVYIGSGDGNFYVLDAATGKQRGRFSSEGNKPIHAGAAITKDLVIFGAYDFYVYALPRGDFTKIAWHKRTGGRINSAPTVSGGAVYIGSDDGGLYKLRLSDGKILWTARTGGPVYAPPVVADGVAYFASWDGHVYAVRTSNGKRVWRTRVDEQVSAPLALAKGKLYGGAAFPDCPLFSLDAKTGKLLHSFTTYGGFDAGPVISGDTLYIGSYDDNFYAVNIDTFEIKWKRRMRDPIRATAAVANNTVFAADMKGRLFAFAPLP